MKPGEYDFEVTIRVLDPTIYDFAIAFGCSQEEAIDLLKGDYRETEEELSRLKKVVYPRTNFHR